jgi:hypothetical protein
MSRVAPEHGAMRPLRNGSATCPIISQTPLQGSWSKYLAPARVHPTLTPYVQRAYLRASREMGKL